MDRGRGVLMRNRAGGPLLQRRMSPRILGLLAAWLVSSAALADVDIRIENPARLPEERIHALLLLFASWSERVYRYLGREPSRPVTAVFSNDVRVGYYSYGRVFLPPGDRDEMIESWVHELAHHVTGHDSSFFFKEGIAVHTLEALLDADGKTPQGWPNYGQSCDAWLQLFARRGELQPLSLLLRRGGYDGSSPEADFRSWQTYLVAGSFTGWLIRTRGIAAFHRAFSTQGRDLDVDALEREWLAEVMQSASRSFDPARQLPQGPRYQYYARRLIGRAEFKPRPPG
jgi:hypothetical protein